MQYAREATPATCDKFFNKVMRLDIVHVPQCFCKLYTLHAVVQNPLGWVPTLLSIQGINRWYWCLPLMQGCKVSLRAPCIIIVGGLLTP